MKSKTMIPVVPEAYDDVCRTVEAICEKFPSKYWRALEDAPLDQRYPESWVSELEQAGILGAGVDEAHGGIELPIGALARIIETINACGATGDVVAEQLALSLFLRNFGSDSARDAVLPLIAEGSARFQSIALWSWVPAVIRQELALQPNARPRATSLRGRRGGSALSPTLASCWCSLAPAKHPARYHCFSWTLQQTRTNSGSPIQRR